MSRDCWAPGMVVSEQEERLYSDLFLLTLPAADSTGRVAAGTKVGELFRASQLPPDTLHQITKLCGAKQLGYFGRGQFYLALKLIAAAQSSLPVQLDSINCELPLPHFLALKSDNEVQKGNAPQSAEIHRQLAHVVALVSTPRGTEGVTGKMQEPWCAATLPFTTPPPSPSYQKRQAVSGEGRPRVGFDQSHTVIHEGSPTAGAAVHPDGQAHGNYVSKPSLAYSFYARKQTSVQRADSESQEDLSDYTDDPWRITEEQREYYFNQFKTLQPDTKLLISGSVAKDFFTKSKLPIRELSHIWELSDMDCDGALTLFEFCAAFHLVVARKNGYSLPATLPETLMPEYLQRSEVSPQLTHEDVHLGSHGNLAVESLPVQQQWTNWNDSEENIVAESMPAILPASTLQQPEQHFYNDKPDLNLITNASSKQISGCKELVYTQRRKTRPRSYSSTSAEDAIKKGEVPPTPPPRLPKTHSRASSLDLNKLFQQGTQAVKSGWSQPPPAVPPRPPIAKASQGSLTDLCPQVKRPSNLGEENSSPVKDTRPRQPPLKPLRRKHRLESQEHLPRLNATSAPDAKLHQQLQKIPSKQKKAIQTAVRKNKEANMILLRLNGELQQQFKEVRKERIALESQLEHFRPVPHT
ncbi:ralBP1-associated Eps domain-containing protein 2 isoform X3 [Scyliorhinus canicula]|uniref:ralBP1-associated Eps domain-containing protein 2 isoform X3 n=1 Tax=Scyliorhinus canicula TaxID=7830 RepID=UPI0018F359A9|nr:ralBP1-associated Eps domain-containing protein 2 isoform X3 [Scyliorhinus canicula]